MTEHSNNGYDRRYPGIILSILNKGKWQDGVTNCGYDYEFTTENETIRYHSECGTFVDITNSKSMVLSGKDRLSINTILGASNSSVSEEEYDVSLAFPAQNKTFETDDEPPTFYGTKTRACNTLADEGVTYAECIVFRMRFRSPIFGGGAWNPNFEYNWSWYLARTTNGDWELLTWGAPGFHLIKSIGAVALK